MRHRMEKNRLGRSSAHREAMLRNMVTSLMEHERVETTVAKAKELRRVADRMVTLAKRGDLHAVRQAMKVIRKRSVAKKLFGELAILFQGRNGGYTRILKVGRRPGDNAEMAIIELVAKTAEKKARKAAAKGKKSAEGTGERAAKAPAARKKAPPVEAQAKAKKSAAPKKEAGGKKGSPRTAGEKGK